MSLWLKPSTQQICNNETIVVGRVIGAPYGDIDNLEVACAPPFRSANAGCQAATCSPEEYTTTQSLAQRLCGSVYSSNATLSSSVSSAIASATSAAKAATEGKDPTDLANFPPCGVSRWPLSATPSHPGKIYELNKNRTDPRLLLLPAKMHPPEQLQRLRERHEPRVHLPGHTIQQGYQYLRTINMQSDGLAESVFDFRSASVSQTNLQSLTLVPCSAIVYLAQKLCEPVLGILTFPVNYTGPTTSNTTNTTLSSPSPVPFTGEAMKVQKTCAGCSVIIIAIGLGLLML